MFFLEKETIPERPSKKWKLFRKGIITILFKPNSVLDVVHFTYTVVLRTSAVFHTNTHSRKSIINMMINSQISSQFLALCRQLLNEFWLQNC